VGLILFGERAYLQAPLTFDRKTVRTLLDESVIGLAGQFTAIGDAIGLAVKRLRERDQKNRVLILLTDGANTAGEVDPIQATRIAAEAGLKIYTVGIGADAMLVNSRFGRRQVNPSRNLDEKALRNIAELTGGRYFRARDTQEMEKIYAELDRLEPVTEEELNYRPTKSLYMWPLSISLILAALLVLYQQRRSTHG
jgi:Ca-activated chloride channel family protein